MEGKRCVHLDKADESMRPRTKGCEECQKIGSSWVSLRLCLSCGHVGCCDSSPNKHGTKHFQETNHPIITDLPGESWKWCYVDKTYL